MKPIHFFGVLLASCALQAQTSNQAAVTANPSPVNYIIGQQDANSQVWQKITQAVDARGNSAFQTNQAYVELATGLNHLVNGQWVASKEEIDISPDGSSAAGTNCQHLVYFPGDIYNGAVKLVEPGGQVIETDPIGLAYFDGTNSVLLAVATNSTGAILPSGNEVIYSNAFAGLNADLIFSYTRAGMEQDVVLRQQPPDPLSMGLNPPTTRLQMLTEFITAPQPSVTPNTVATEAGNLEDDTLSFGTMQMGQGNAFLIGPNSPSVPVDKQWVTIQGRQFLVEEVPIVAIAAAIDTLPPFSAQAGSGFKPVVSKGLPLPSRRLVRIPPKTRFLTRAEPPSHGLLLDYQTINGGLTNQTFAGDSTYYVSGPTYLYGSNCFEGGAVLKYTNGAWITLESGPLNWLASLYRPVILTAKDDNTVGEVISGSSNSPTGYYAKAALQIANTGFNQPISNFRIAYAQQAVSFLSGGVYQFYDGQIVDCQNGFSGQVVCKLRNMLFSNVQTNFNQLGNSAFRVENATFASNVFLSTIKNVPYQAATLTFTNCIFANVTALTNTYSSPYLTYQISGLSNGFYDCSEFGIGQNTNIFYPFQSVGAGNYYLTNGCNFCNAGTTNIDPSLLADLQTRTTFPPALVYSNVTIANSTWVPLVQRDTSTMPSLGYHYSPIDYAVSGVTVSGTLTLSNGVAVATFQSVSGGSSEPGFTAGSGDWLTSVGTALVHNQICHYAAVQEQSILWGGHAFTYAVPFIVSGSNYFGATAAVLYARFTDFNGLAGLGTSAAFAASSPTGVRIGGGDPMELNLRDCRVGPGWIVCDTYQGTETNICINNLFDRGGVVISDFDGDSPVVMFNNLVHNGYMDFDNENLTYTWTVQNNFFDNSTLNWGNGLSENYNGYWNTAQLTPTGGNDVVVTGFKYDAGPLGNYYQDSSSLLNMGSVAASSLGLYHYATQTNMVWNYTLNEYAEFPEGDKSPPAKVDIGFHYVAVDQNGNPLDNNGDGIPDYLEDANGNGVVDSGEIGWNIAGDLGLKVLIIKPRNGSILP